MEITELNDVFKLFAQSGKWISNYYDEYPRNFAVFQRPAASDRDLLVKVSIPMVPGARRPDFSKPWTGLIIHRNLEGVTRFSYLPEGPRNNLAYFTRWVYHLVNGTLKF